MTDPSIPTTTIENPGYTTQSVRILREEVQFQYIYDPINNIMKRVEKKGQQYCRGPWKREAE